MPWDGNGTFTRDYKWQDDATADVKIRADRHDSNDDDIANAISNTIAKDGQSRPTNDIPMNNKKITQLADPTEEQDAANKKYVDTFKTYSGGINITGADDNGRVVFSSTTGANGLSWTAADMSWIARLATAELPGPPIVPATKNRLVLNDKPDGSGADVIEMREDGTALLGPDVTAKGTSAAFRIVPTSGNGAVYWMSADGKEQRAVMYTTGGAQGHLYVGLSSGATARTWAFGTDGHFYVGAASFQTNGNIVGTVWATWGSQSAYDAIAARIESRAQACAVAYSNNCIQQMRSAGYVESDHTTGSYGQRRTWSGYYCVMSLRVEGDHYVFGYRQIQHYVPAAGWLQSTAW